MTKRDLVGRQFGHWAVVAFSHTNERRQKKYICKCDCGTKRIVDEYLLIYGTSKSCGCAGRTKTSTRNEPIGQRFGRLMVISFSHFDKHGIGHFICRCDCGRTIIRRRTKLGETSSCGCAQQSRFKISIGQRFTQLTVISKEGSRYYACQCDCGNTKVCRADHLAKGMVKSCGCTAYPKPKEELIGHRFGKLVVTGISLTKTKGGHHRYTCQCDCGNVKVIAGSHLLNSDVTSCGCGWYSKPKEEMIGRRFGRLVVLRFSHTEQSTQAGKYVCQCDCGKIKVIARSALVSGATVSCGCYSREVVSRMNAARTAKNHYGHRYYFEHDGESVCMRSSLEIMAVAALISRDIEWQYEPRYFTLEKTRRYRPDFYLPITDEWIEVKGYMKPGEQEKIDLFQSLGYKIKVWFDKDIEKILGIRYGSFWKKLNKARLSNQTLDLAELTGNLALAGCKVRAATSPKP